MYINALRIDENLIELCDFLNRGIVDTIPYKEQEFKELDLKVSKHLLQIEMNLKSYMLILANNYNLDLENISNTVQFPENNDNIDKMKNLKNNNLNVPNGFKKFEEKKLNSKKEINEEINSNTIVNKRASRKDSLQEINIILPKNRFSSQKVLDEQNDNIPKKKVLFRSPSININNSRRTSMKSDVYVHQGQDSERLQIVLKELKKDLKELRNFKKNISGQFEEKKNHQKFKFYIILFG